MSAAIQSLRNSDSARKSDETRNGTPASGGSDDPSAGVFKSMLRTLEEAHHKNAAPTQLTDVEWDIRKLAWEKERHGWIRQMEENSIWAMGSSPHSVKRRQDESENQLDITNENLNVDDLMILTQPRNLFGLDPNLLRGIQSEMSTAHMLHPSQPSLQQSPSGTGTAYAQTVGTTATGVTSVKTMKTAVEKSQGHSYHPKTVAGPVTVKPSAAPTKVNKAAVVQVQTIAPQKGKTQARMKKMTRLELLKFVAEWDKGSFGKRDMILIEFIKCYKTKENIYCSDQLFHCGGSLIFGRFVISMQMCFLKHRRVWHYFDGLTVFVKSLQGDRYTEEFLRLGGLGFICEVIRVEVSNHSDKLHACKFLVHLMKGRNSIAVKMFICDNPHFLESLIDSLTMCKDKKLVTYCGHCFENLCIEATIPNVMTVTSYVMRLLPCDFNPMIQSMAFRVLQSVIRLKPSVGTRCVKPILDNLKTDDMDLLVEMSNLSLVILQTKSGPELINQLMAVAEGIHLREQFKSVFRPHMRKGRGQLSKYQVLEIRKAREKHERVRQRMNKYDHFMTQAGALFVLNRMMTDKIDFVAEFTRQGIFGLSLKTLGSCPHWEVQGQGVTMIQFLHAMSIECAISYSLMLPLKMMKLILTRPAECLRYFTAPICVLLRKLGRFALRLWPRWMEKVVVPAKAVSEGGDLPDYFIDMCKMTRKVNEIQLAIAELLENPVMESYSKSTDSQDITTDKLGMPQEPTEEEIMKEFVTDDEDDFVNYRTGKELLFEGRNYKAFERYLDFQSTLSDDKLDTKVDKSQQNMLLPAKSTQGDLSAMEETLLQDAEMKNQVKPSTVPLADRVAAGGGMGGGGGGLQVPSSAPTGLAVPSIASTGGVKSTASVESISEKKSEENQSTVNETDENREKEQ